MKINKVQQRYLDNYLNYRETAPTISRLIAKNFVFYMPNFIFLFYGVSFIHNSRKDSDLVVIGWALIGMLFGVTCGWIGMLIREKQQWNVLNNIIDWDKAKAFNQSKEI